MRHFIGKTSQILAKDRLVYASPKSIQTKADKNSVNTFNMVIIDFVLKPLTSLYPFYRQLHCFCWAASIIKWLWTVTSGDINSAIFLQPLGREKQKTLLVENITLYRICFFTINFRLLIKNNNRTFLILFVFVSRAATWKFIKTRNYYKIGLSALCRSSGNFTNSANSHFIA